MAKKATSLKSTPAVPGFFKDMKSFLVNLPKDHPEELRIAAIAAGIAFFFTHGLPLWDQDYARWLVEADQGILKLLGRILLPITSDPAGWGYSDRPMQALLYKIYSMVFGTWGTGYFLMKSLAFGGLCGMIYHWMRALGVDRAAATVAIALFGLSSNALASVIWHADFGAYSQLIMVALLFWALPQVQKGPTSTNVYKKGWGGMPKAFRAFLVVFTLVVYFGAKVKGDVRLAPVILLAYLYLFDRDRAKVFAAPFGIAFFLTLPISGAMFTKLPPFFPGVTGYAADTYGSFSVARIVEFLFGGLFKYNYGSISILGAMGGLSLLAAVAYVGYRFYRNKVKAPDARMGFFLVWFGVAILACGIIKPEAAQAYAIRHTLLAIVPLAMILALGLQALSKDFAKVKWFKPAFAAVLVLQVGMHLYHDVQIRRDLGRTMVAVDKLYGEVEKNHANSQFVYLPGFLPYGYKASPAPAIQTRKPLARAEELASFPAGQTMVASWSPSLDPQFSVAAVLQGCGSSLFDAVVRCEPADGAYLLKYVGAIPELAQSDEKARAGDLNGARDIIQSYLQRDPNNHGVNFVLGLHTYRTKEWALNEAIYDRIGPYHLTNPSVVYNWGLAKQGVQKYKEAARYLEVAYQMAPLDYGIGFNLADAYVQLGKKRRALATMNDLMKKYPNDPAMKQVYEDWSKR